jgi:hypothetical protein
VRLIKMFGLAAIAAVAAMAFIGASSASATMLCKVKTDPCPTTPTNQLIPVNTVLKAKLKAGTSATLKAGFAEVVCTASTVEGKVTNAGGGAGVAVLGSITSATWTSCTCTGQAATATAEALPWSAELNWVAGNNGSMKVTGVKVKVVCLGETCFYGGEVKGLEVVGGNPAHVLAAAGNVKITRLAGSGIFCANPAEWIADYEVTEPNPLYVTNG